MRFQDLGLLPELVTNAGYETATPVQTEAIPAILEGHDVLAGAQTGTGKTAAFTLPVLQRLMADHSTGKPRALILAPTRELAVQVATSVRDYGKGTKLRHTCVYGGVNFGAQIKAIRQGLDILIATPGRLLDHVNQRTLDLSDVRTLILDEADRMLDMGFVEDIGRIIKACHPNRQTLLFSATYSRGIKTLAAEYLKSPVEIAVARDNTVAASVEQTFVHVDQEKKRELLTQLIGMNNMHQVLVFTKTKFGADKLAKALTDDGLPSVAMHGNKSQAQRTKALEKFKRGSARILVATDVAARGIDIQKLPHVINFELPMVAEDYVHRIGRTGRAGETGAAISFVCAGEHKLLLEIQRVLKTEISFEVADGFEPRVPFPSRKPKQKTAPRKHGGGGRGPRAADSGRGRSSDARGSDSRREGRSYEGRGENRAEGRRDPRAADGRPARSNDSRPERGNDARPARAADGRSDSRPARAGEGQRSARYGDDRRPARAADGRSDSRPARQGDSRPARSGDARPARAADGRGDSRPARDGQAPHRGPRPDARPARSGDARPARSGDARPARAEGSRSEPRVARDGSAPARRPAGARPSRSSSDRSRSRFS